MDKDLSSFIVAIFGSMKPNSFLYCVLFGMFIIPFLAVLHPPHPPPPPPNPPPKKKEKKESKAYIVCYKNWDICKQRVSVPIAVQIFLKPRQGSNYGK